jgi:hypothetical protein
MKRKKKGKKGKKEKNYLGENQRIVSNERTSDFACFVHSNAPYHDISPH